MNRKVSALACLLFLGGVCSVFSAMPYKPAGDAEEAIARIEELGGSVRLITTKGKELEADFQFSGNALADEHLQLLRHLPEIEILRLKNVSVTDAGLAHLTHLPNLRHLHLDHSKVTDNGLKHLKPLTKLAFLSLYGTKVSDDSIDDLSRIPRLRQIFLSKTGFTAEGLSRLSKAAPGLAVHPNPEHEKETLAFVRKISRESLARAEALLPPAEKNFKEFDPRKEELKKAHEAEKKKADTLRKQADAARKTAEEAKRVRDDLKRKFTDAESKAKAKPEDDKLAKTMEDFRRKLEDAEKKHEKLAHTYEQAKQASDLAQASLRTAEELRKRADNAKKKLEEAKILVESARIQAKDAATAYDNYHSKNAQAASRGFWYSGYRHADNPFAKEGSQLWVSPNGDDAQAGSKDRPWRTLGKARSSMAGGDVLNILPGLYFFNCQFGPAGTNEDRKTVWRAVGKGRVVIAADEKFTPPYWSLSDNLSIQGLWLGGSFKFAHKAGGGSYSSRNSEIIGCTFFNGNGFAGGPAYNWLFQDNRMVHLGKGTHGHSAYMAGGVRHDLPWNSRNLRVLGNTLIGGEGYALHCWHSPVSATLAGNFTSGNFWSVVLQGPNHSCHHNVFWKPRGNMLVNDEGTMGFNAWLPARLRRFDHLIFGSTHPVWQKKMPAMRSLAPIEKIYLLHDARMLGVPDKEHILLTGKPWTGKLGLPKTKGEAARIPVPKDTIVRPAFFPRTASEIDIAVEAIQNYFRDHNPREIAEDKSDILENLFDKLEVQYTTVPSDYALFPPMSQDKDDGTYGVH